MDFVLQAIAFINSAGLQENIFVASLRWLFVMVSAFFLILIIFVMSTNATWKSINVLSEVNEFVTSRPPGLRPVGKKMKKIRARIDTNNEAEYKLAIIEADTILGETLENMSIQGETTEQRLSQATKIMIPTIDDVAEAHQTRNSIVYDPDFRISLAEARRILDIYENAFRGLDLMG
jgi:ABC-type iron transport system FetAB permease component